MLTRVVATTALAIGLATSTAEAAIITLNDCGTLANVIANGCTIGDKAFANVTFSVDVGDSAAVAAGIQVVGITDNTLGANFGFRLQGINAGPLVSENGTLSAVLGYQVSVLDPLAFLITDLHLGINSSGSVIGLITETATDLNLSTQVGVLQGCVNPDPAACAALAAGNVDSVVFGPISAVGVVKVISLTALPGGEVQSVDQIVTQQAVPEPATIILLSSAVAGFAARRRMGLTSPNDRRSV